jgi:hypothetical protein
MRSTYQIVALTLCGTAVATMAANPKSLGSSPEVQKDEHYASARLKMNRLGWQIDREWGVSGVHRRLAFPQYPEVLCGEGYQAVCTGRFTKGDSAVLLTINQFKKSLPVERIDND